MRRTDRQVTDINEIKKILDECYVCRVALLDKDMPYIIPLNYGYSEKEGKFEFYFHCAKEGKKLDLINENNNACFEIDGCHEFIEKEIDCQCGMAYKSVVAKGKAYIINDEKEQMEALHAIIYRCRGGCDTYNVAEKQLESIVIFKIVADEITAKQRINK